MQKKYKVHKLDIKIAKEQDRLEQFINSLEGEVISILPDTKPFFLFYGARVDTVFIVEKLKD
jgi:hypothetical protein